MNWYYHAGEMQCGPIPEEQLMELRRTGSVTADSLVWREGMANWAPYREAGPAVNLDAAPMSPAVPPVVLAPPVMQPAPYEAICAECGRIFPRDEMIAHGPSCVCAGCKPVFLQKLAEGARVGMSSATAALRYAGFWIRFGAKMLDGVVLGVVIVIPMVVVLGMQAAASPDREEPPMLFMMTWQLAYYVVMAAYDIFFIGKYGATPGKMVCRIRVVSAEGAQIAYGRATGRFFANILSGMICYIGYIIAGFDDQKRALHDHICNTRVVYKD